MRKNKKLTIVISIVLVLAVASAILGYLFLATDMFRSNKELFSKYISQNGEVFQKLLDLKADDIYERLKSENKYESNTSIKMTHSEGGEVSNPLNNLALKLEIQKDNDEQYLYADGQILYENDEYLETEIIKEKEIYGIRFSDAVKQFITLEKDENLEIIAENIGIDVEQLEVLMNENDPIISKDEITSLKDKYFNIVIQEFSKGTFEKQKNAMITYNDVTIETNAYAVSLSSEQVENMLIEILNNAKNETEILEKLQTIIDKEDIINKIDELISNINEKLEIPTLKVTVYEQKQKNIRTVIEVGGDKIIVENSEQNEETKMKINYLKLNNDEEKEYIFEISKKNAENQEVFNIDINVIEGEINYTINLLSKIELTNDTINFNTEVSHKQDITTISLLLENEVKIGNSFEKAQSLTQGNNILLNNLEEQRRIELINLLKELVPQKVNERIGLLKQKFGLEESVSSENEGTGENAISQIEINKFNAKFEFYTGDEVSAENVKMLLAIVKNHLKYYEITGYETQENSENTNVETVPKNIKLNIEKDIVNEEATNQILDKIEDSKKYKIQIFYNESNGLIDYITITEV